jgi:YHS domain-containing protein
MSPLKIVILAVLFYVLFRLLFGSKKVDKPASKPVPEELGANNDVLVEDPVCHTYVPRKMALRAVKDGETYFFCSEKCCQIFLENKGK